MTRYGTCDCGKWGIAPSHFNETKHFMVCICGKDMYMITINPREAGYREQDKIEPRTRKHGVKLD